MPTPRSNEARRFFRCARQSREDAELLFESGRNTGAVYLAGYAVECMLKALILAATPASRASEVLDGFRGGKAHGYNYLRDWYRSTGGPASPPPINRAFALLQDWSTDLRYSPADLRRSEAGRFLRAVDVVMDWSKGRF